MALPLAGIRVVEMSHMVMGPSCGMFLAQLGAEVIKVEPPEGDKTRALHGMGASFFPTFNRGKRSIVLDLKSDEGRAALHRLLATADVFVENFKDETLAKLGLDSTSLRRQYPRLIVAAHKGFLSGPYQHRTALDEVVQMMTGLAYMTGPAGRPLRTGSSGNDIMGGLFGAFGVLAALLERNESGRGKEIRVGLFENCLMQVAQHMVHWEVTGERPKPMPERDFSWPLYDTFDTADGRQVFVAVVTGGHWQSFCKAFGLDDLLDDPALSTQTGRIKGRDGFLPRVRDVLKAFTAADLSARLDDLGLPYSPINTPVDLFDDPHVTRPGGLVVSRNADGSSFRCPALPLEFDGALPEPAADVPAVGADSTDILGELGYTPADITVLARRKTA